MTELNEFPTLRNPVLIAAFEGWNDAGEAASSAVKHLRHVWRAQPLVELDPEDYHDFQVNRPMVHTDAATGSRRITWPTTRLYWASPPGASRDVLLVRGIEPSMRWRTFCSEILGYADELEVTTVVTMGALLADVPHTRPIPISVTSEDPALMRDLSLERSSYEGPTGIVGILQDAAKMRGLAGMSLWSAVPHYVGNTACPKATLALISRLEEVLDLAIALEDLPEEALAWERGVNELADEDEEIREYVRQLESVKETTDLPEASGEAIAREFERYLRRRDDDAPPEVIEDDDPPAV